jgi:hypothetical protein
LKQKDGRKLWRKALNPASQPALDQSRYLTRLSDFNTGFVSFVTALNRHREAELESAAYYVAGHPGYNLKDKEDMP